MILILTGQVNSGKTTAVENWIKNKRNVKGILSPKKDQRYFYNISNEEVFQTECSEETQDKIFVGRYCFCQKSLTKANSIILNEVEKADTGYLIIDELGKLELAEQGLFPAAKQSIEKLQFNKSRHLLLIVRDYLVDDVVTTFGITNYRIIKKEDVKDL